MMAKRRIARWIGRMGFLVVTRAQGIGLLGTGAILCYCLTAVVAGGDGPPESTNVDFVINASLRRIPRLRAPGKYGEFWGYLPAQGQRYWTGETLMFSAKPLELWLSPQRPIFVPRNGGETWGVGFKWKRPLEPGYEYTFIFDFRLPSSAGSRPAGFPDYIVVDRQIVWTFERRSDPEALHRGLPPLAAGGAHSRETSVVFKYIPQKTGEGEILFVRDVGRGWHKTENPIAVPAVRTRWYHVCYRRATAEPPGEYPTWDPPYEIRHSPHLLPTLDECVRPLDWKGAPLQKPPYPTDDVHLGFRVWAGEDAGIFDLLESLGVDGIWMEAIPESAEAQAKMREKIENDALRFTIVSTDQLDRIKPAKRARAVALVNRFHQEFPGLEVYLIFPELMIPTLGRHKELELFPRYEPWPYSYATFSDESIEHGPAMQREWVEHTLSRLEHPKGVRTVMMVTPAIEPLWNYYRAKPSIVMKKSIHRQSIQANIANARGAARMYGKAWAFRTDAWLLWNGAAVWPLEMEQAWRVAFASGASFIDQEGNVATVATNRGTRITDTGAALARAVKWMRLHPCRGRQIVPYAIMRGVHDRWGKLNFWPDLPLQVEQPFERHRMLRSFDLLNVFFADFGNYKSTRYDRYCTGTPLGPVDQITVTANMTLLSTYRFIIYLGLEPIAPQAGPGLVNFVRSGGTLFCSAWALSKLRERDGSVLLSMTVGEGTGKEEDVPGADTWPEGKVFNRLSVKPKGAKPILTVGDAPVVTRRKEGAGEVWVVATEYLGDLSYDLLSALVTAAARPHAPLAFDPPDNRIEYTLQQKDGGYVINVFRHVGLDHTYTDKYVPVPYQGTVTVDVNQLAAFGTDVEVIRVDDSMGTSPVKTTFEKPCLQIPLTMLRHTELILAPKGRARAAFFAKE